MTNSAPLDTCNVCGLCASNHIDMDHDFESTLARRAATEAADVKLAAEARADLHPIQKRAAEARAEGDR